MMNGLKRVGLVLLTVFLMSAAALIINLFSSSPVSNASILRDGSHLIKPSAVPGNAQPDHEEPIGVKLQDIQDTGYLRLIDREHGVGKEPFELTEFYEGDYYYRTDIAWAVEGFLQYMEDKDNELYIASAYRTEEEQAKLYEEMENKSLVQPAGFSEHQTGLALDLHPVEILMGDSPRKLHKKITFMNKEADSFGFILRYPEGKEAITGIDPEYWHFRYVGIPHASFMAKHDLTLEEYLSLLKYKGQLDHKGAHGTYRIYWREPQDGEIRFYSGLSHEISSTNTGAFIVTVKLEGNE